MAFEFELIGEQVNSITAEQLNSLSVGGQFVISFNVAAYDGVKEHNHISSNYGMITWSTKGNCAFYKGSIVGLMIWSRVGSEWLMPPAATTVDGVTRLSEDKECGLPGMYYRHTLEAAKEFGVSVEVSYQDLIEEEISFDIPCASEKTMKGIANRLKNNRRLGGKLGGRVVAIAEMGYKTSGEFRLVMRVKSVLSWHEDVISLPKEGIIPITNEAFDMYDNQVREGLDKDGEKKAMKRMAEGLVAKYTPDKFGVGTKATRARRAYRMAQVINPIEDDSEVIDV